MVSIELIEGVSLNVNLANKHTIPLTQIASNKIASVVSLMRYKSYLSPSSFIESAKLAPKYILFNSLTNLFAEVKVGICVIYAILPITFTSIFFTPFNDFNWFSINVFSLLQHMFKTLNLVLTY